MDWETIWKVHWQEIYRYIFFRIRDRHEAEDLTQDTFMRAMKVKQRDIASVQGLLKTIAKNLVIDRWRKNQGVVSYSLDQRESQGVIQMDPFQALESLEQQDEICRALDRLTREQQLVLKLRLIRGFSIKETAEQMGKSEGAIKTLQSRALMAIRKHMGATK